MQPQTPITPVQQPDTNFNFTPDPNAPQPQQPVQQQPLQPVQQPQPDPAITQLQSDIAEIKSALTPQQPAPVSPAPDTQKKYDEWGSVFQDTALQAEQIVEQKLAEREQAVQQTNEQVTQQEQQNQVYIDNTVNQLRQAGYLPPVGNQFDANDPGKQAENELLGYAVYGLGSTNLVKAAQELKFRHDAGYKYDYSNKGFVQANAPSNNPNDMLFGNPGQPQQPTPVTPLAPQYPQPVGPQNPYMPPQQYPAGFNAPVSNGSTFQGTQGSTPSLRALRTNSYDGLVDAFNRTQ